MAKNKCYVTYRPEDFPPKSDEEISLIFENLKAKALDNIPMSEHEKDFFSIGVRLSQRGDGKWSDYNCCENFAFKFIYLSYYNDLTGGSTYYKPKKTTLEEVSIEEAQQDLKWLIGKADDWNSIISTTRHSENLLQIVSKECRDELKGLNSSPECLADPYYTGRFVYKYKKWNILLYSRYIYCVAKKIFEIFNSQPINMSLNSTGIEFNEYSLIHILSRHYAPIIKKHKPNKSYHREDFIPEYLNRDISTIFSEIDKSEIWIDQSIHKIQFQFKEVDYVIWIDKATNCKNVEYQRINTFYPIEEEFILIDLKNNYNRIKINENLSVYKNK